MFRTGASVKGELISKSSKLKFRDAGFHGCFRALQNIAHLPREPIRLRDPANFRVAITRAQNARELSVPVKPFIIHLDDEHMIEPGENIYEPRRQRRNMF